MNNIKHKINELCSKGKMADAYYVLLEAIKNEQYDKAMLLMAVNWAAKAHQKADLLNCLDKAKNIQGYNQKELVALSAGALQYPSLYHAIHFKRVEQKIVSTNGVKYELAVLLYRFNEYDEAETLFKEILVNDKDNPSILGALGELYAAKGEFETAISCYEKLVDKAGLNGLALFSIAQIKKFTLDNSSFLGLCEEQLKKVTDVENRNYILFAKAKYFVDINSEEMAWDSLVEANQLQQARNPFDAKSFRDSIVAIQQAETNLSVNFETDSNEASPIFIVGMPRSGTTLLEQMLSRANITALGESSALTNAISSVAHEVQYPAQLNSFTEVHYETLRTYFNNYIKTNYANLTHRVVDKLPGSFLYIGSIMRMFPNAKIINMKRNYHDCAFSIYSKFFRDHMSFTSSIEGIECFYQEYERLMLFWKTQYQENILDVNYEDLTVNPEEISKEIFSFIGEDWSKSVISPKESTNLVQTPSLWQVRQNIAPHSKGRYKYYVEKIKGMMLKHKKTDELEYKPV